MANLHNIPIGNVEKLVSNFFGKENYVIIKTKKITPNQSQWLKSYIEFNTKKRIESVKNGGKDGKA